MRLAHTYDMHYPGMHHQQHQSCFGTASLSPFGAPSKAMAAAARRLLEEILDGCRQQSLLALRRSILPTTPLRITRKKELIADVEGYLMAYPDCSQSVFEELFVIWTTQDLRMLRARMKTLGYTLPVVQRPRRPDLIAAFVSARECIANPPAVSKRTREDTCPSAGACSSDHSVRARRGRARTHAVHKK